MLNTKFRGSRSTGSRDEEFRRVFTIYGHGGHLGQVTSIILIYLHFRVPLQLTYNILLKMAKWFLRKSRFNFH